MIDHAWLGEGLRFECQRCGGCCVSHGEYAYVYITRRGVQTAAAHLGVTQNELLERFCEHDEWRQVVVRSHSDECVFLGPQGGCWIYPARPKQCATWPFWTENLNAAAWEGPVSACCPGVGVGPLHAADEILRTARERDDWYESDGEL